MSRTLTQDKPLQRALFLAAVLASLVLGVPTMTWALSYTFTTLDVPGSTSTEALAINAAGQVGGWYSAGTRRYGFLFSNDSFSTLDVPGSTSTMTYDINDVGQMDSR